MLALTLLVTAGAASTPPKQQPNVLSTLTLRIKQCSNGAACAGASVLFTVFHNDSTTTGPYTSYTNPSGDVSRQLSVQCEERVRIDITPSMGSITEHRDYKFVGSCENQYDEWVILDFGDGGNQGVGPCSDVKGNNNPIDWTIYLQAY